MLTVLEDTEAVDMGIAEIYSDLFYIIYRYNKNHCNIVSFENYEYL